MTPLEFLQGELRNIERALAETLRRDYGPERSREYFEECEGRLERIKSAAQSVTANDPVIISARLTELSNLATWISLIERSHLGEFSWPFADELRRMANILLVETNLKGEVTEPIIHVVAEATGYRIVYESRIPATTGKRRFVFVAFPRSLKHHVLLHTIFGHELGHTALHTIRAGQKLRQDVIGPLIKSGAMKSGASILAWLCNSNAPLDVKQEIALYESQHGPFQLFPHEYWEKWVVELFCDLFGLLLFGPSFFAAHQALLEPLHPNPFALNLEDSTHPPYAVRTKMLVQAMKCMNWHRPVTTDKKSRVYKAEKMLLDRLMNNTFPLWSSVFTDVQIKTAILGIQGVFAIDNTLGYKGIHPDDLSALVERIANRLPPTHTSLDDNGKPLLREIDITESLYAGWVFWEGRIYFENNGLDFITTNRLCDYALLQQKAINMAIRDAV